MAQTEIPRFYVVRGRDAGGFEVFNCELFNGRVTFGFSTRDKAEGFRIRNAPQPEWHVTFVGYDAFMRHLSEQGNEVLFSYLEVDAVEVPERRLYCAACVGQLVEGMKFDACHTGDALYGDFQPLDGIDLWWWGPDGTFDDILDNMR